MPTSYTKQHQGPAQWPAATVDLLIRMREHGFSGSECALGLARARMGTFSRSAVMGKIKRLERRGLLKPVQTTTAIYTLSYLSTGDVLGTFLRDVCDIPVW